MNHELEVAQLVRERDRLRSENLRLSRLLRLRGQDVTPAPQQLVANVDPPGMVTMSSLAADKLRLFTQMFAPRTDVYAVRWENHRTGASGWMPAVAGGWRRGMRRSDATYLPLTSEALTALSAHAERPDLVPEKISPHQLRHSKAMHLLENGVNLIYIRDILGHTGVRASVGCRARPAVKTWLSKHPHFQMHFTPTYSSWINQVERLFAEVTRHLLQRSDHRSVQALEKDLREWVKGWNKNPKPFIWTKTADQILASLGRLLQRTTDGKH